MMGDGVLSRLGRFSAVTVAAVLAASPLTPAPARAAVTPPVVLVHGLNSSAATWEAYLGPSGFLASVGRQGYAVGDGQAPGTMRTGDLVAPFDRTNTIAENAAVLRDYIADVKRQTGAAAVDLVAHSMGGLISRYYIDQLMEDRDVRQLIMLGTPHGGSACAGLPARLGMSVPATVELRPSYLRDIFNRQVTQRHGIPFHLLSGNAFTLAVQSPCTDAPSDLVVSVASVRAIGGQSTLMSIGHTDMTGSRRVFDRFVAPLLDSGAEPFTPATPVEVTAEEEQFVALAAGRVARGSRVEQVINIDHVAVATFAIFDPSRSLAVQVRGASGNVIDLDPSNNGLITVDDPASLVHLGYGFDNPRPGPWQVILFATDRTPTDGAHFAVTAQVRGGVQLHARVDELLPALGERVEISASLTLAGQEVPARRAIAIVRAPDGSEQQLTLAGSATVTGSWLPRQSGLHSIDVLVTADRDGVLLERSAFLAVEIQSEPASTGWRLAGLVAVVLLTGLGAIAVIVRARRRRRSARRVAVV